MKNDQNQCQTGIDVEAHVHSFQSGTAAPARNAVSVNALTKACGRISLGVKETGILMKGPLVLATLADLKTQTRRIAIKTSQPDVVVPCDWDAEECSLEIENRHAGFRYWKQCPYGKPGDRLWVREMWRYCCMQRAADGQRAATVEYDVDLTRRTIALRDTDKEPKPRGQKTGERCDDYVRYLNKWWARNRPSMFMPRWASRITLEITGIRVERLQDISESDAIAEGIERTGRHWKSYSGPGRFCRSPISSYQTLWESINGAGSWAANPLVWVVEFKRV